MGRPSIYPTGVTIYDSSKAFNGYTLIPTFYGATLIDMNGRLKKIWKGVTNPVKPLSEGTIFGSQGNVPGKPGATSLINALKIDWNGNISWRYNNNKEITFPDGEKKMCSCHHHDLDVLPNGNALLLTHNRVWDPVISDKQLLDERIIEVTPEGETVWEWKSHEHFEEFGLDEAAKRALYAYPMMDGDWIHLNAMSHLGENHFYNEGDERFNPDNILCSSRQLNIIFIIDKKTGKLVWRLGPDYTISPEQQAIGQIIGQHNAHMIPEGMPGAGNILVFDNGSFGGFGAPNPCAPRGTDAVRRHYSRVVEINPSTLELVWEYMKAQRNAEDVNEMNATDFFSAYISSAQRLPNGNTLIDEGADGLVIEVTPEKEIVWEFVNPIEHPYMPPLMRRSLYRAYRVPYDWAPIEKPDEFDIKPIDINSFRVPGSADPGDPQAVETIVEF